MKKLLFLFSLFCCFTSFGKNLSVYFSHCTFNRPGGTPFVETYLNVSGSSVSLLKNERNEWQGKIEVQWIYKKGDQVVHADKYSLMGPVVADSLQRSPDFIDQQRVSLENGDYTIELKITDKIAGGQTFVGTQHIRIDYRAGEVQLSDIELIESYKPVNTASAISKNGFEIVPLV